MAADEGDAMWGKRMRRVRDTAFGCFFVVFLLVPGALAHAMVPYDAGWIGEAVVWLASIGPLAIIILVAAWTSPFFRTRDDI